MVQVYNLHFRSLKRLKSFTRKLLKGSKRLDNLFKIKQLLAVTSLLNSLEWDTLEERREMSRLSMLFKIQNGLVDLNPSDFYSKSDSRTRGSKFHQIRSHTPAHKTPFFPRTLSQWNKLPPAITTDKTL